MINGYLGELCETIATHQTDTSAKLRDLCFQVNDKVPCTEAVIGSYVSTESLLVNKGGRQVASSLPAMGKVTEYKVGDTLVSNIRPYFKKIWFADQEGTCSGDVIVFRALEAQNAPYVYSILRTSSFFDWVMLGSKGTKMPRGDKKQMMNYPVSLSCKETDLELLSSATKWISSNERQNGRLSELRDVLLPKLMSGEIDVSKVEVPTQPNSHLYLSGNPTTEVEHGLVKKAVRAPVVVHLGMFVQESIDPSLEVVQELPQVEVDFEKAIGFQIPLHLLDAVAAGRHLVEDPELYDIEGRLVPFNMRCIDALVKIHTAQLIAVVARKVAGKT